MRDEEKTKDQLIAELLEARDKLSKMAMFAMERGLASARVRAEAVAMRSSDDLMNVVGTVFREIKHLGMDIHIATISLREEGADKSINYRAVNNPSRYGTTWDDQIVEFDAEVVVRRGSLPRPEGGWSEPDPEWTETNYTKEDLGTVMRGWGFLFDSQEWLSNVTGQFWNRSVPFEYGTVSCGVRERDDRLVDIIHDLSDGISLGYVRFLDFRNLEEANLGLQAQTERKSAFLASMSHELRTPMNAIKGFTNLVLRRGKDQPWERSEENLQKVSHASDHLLTMINDLLDLSKIEAGRMYVNPETFDVAQMIRDSCDTVSPLMQEGVELKQDVPDDIGEVNTDRARVQQMVINLLSNAIKFTDKGTVTVSASRLASRSPTAHSSSGASAKEDSPLPTPASLIISVSDTGKGIPADELPTLFDEYRQVEGSESSVQKGTGLGLSITKKFAELLGGSIGVDSEIGKGSTFTVRVPVTYHDDNP